MGNHLCGQEEPHATLKIDEPISVGKGFKFYDAPENKPTVLICAMDYPQLPSHLTCTYDSRNMEELCRYCGINEVHVMTDEQQPLTKERVTETIEGLLSDLRSGDTFVFYYSGHGTNLRDVADHEDGEDEDEAYCFQNESGQIDQYSCMTDDQFASIMTEHTPRGVNVIVLSDCCHSDTICDFSKSSWRGIKAASISGCEDGQTSGDVGTGGVFTHAMLNAIEQLQVCQDNGTLDAGAYSVGLLYNVTLWSKEDRFSKQSQNICIENTPDMRLKNAVWPFIPDSPYIAPINKRSRGIGDANNAVQPGIEQLTHDSSDTDGSGMLASIGKQ